jgi:nucleoside-diphosphate-sugar epimerase
MRVVVTGASGNVGSAVVQELARQPQVEEVVGVCRRAHGWRPAGVRWVWADVAGDDLSRHLTGADALIHLAWLFHPMRRPTVTWHANVEGTKRVLEAVAHSETPAVVVASSVGAYAARHDPEPVDESWPTDGVPQAAYSREKAYVERLLDLHERAHPELRVVRMRPAFIFQEAAATQQRRLFLGPFVPRSLLRPGRVPVLPLPRDLLFQALHTSDVARAYVSAALGDAAGPFNLAADPVLGPPELADLFGARWLPTPAPALRAAVAAGFRARLLPAAPELFDLLMSVPLMSTNRARNELEWSPTVSAVDAVRAFATAPAQPRSPGTPPLAQDTSGPARLRELATGVGHRP